MTVSEAWFARESFWKSQGVGTFALASRKFSEFHLFGLASAVKNEFLTVPTSQETPRVDNFPPTEIQTRSQQRQTVHHCEVIIQDDLEQSPEHRHSERALFTGHMVQASSSLGALFSASLVKTTCCNILCLSLSSASEA